VNACSCHERDVENVALGSSRVKDERAIYVTLKPPWALNDIVKGLAECVKKELSNDPREVYVTVDTNKADVVEYLDREFDVSRHEAFKKVVHLEINKKEIDSYDYFRIMPKAYELGKGIYGAVKRPTCNTESCPIGASLILPLRITPAICRRIGIGCLFHRWPQPWELLLSTRVKQIFESEGISGLEYVECIVETRGGHVVKEMEPLYLATPARLLYDYADSILINKGTFCEKHSVIFSYQLFGNHVCRSDLAGYDFNSVERVKIGSKEYIYSRHHLIVSRKVVKLLLAHKIPGLLPIGFYHGERFLPIMPVNADVSLYNY